MNEIDCSPGPPGVWTTNSLQSELQFDVTFYTGNIMIDYVTYMMDGLGLIL